MAVSDASVEARAVSNAASVAVSVTLVLLVASPVLAVSNILYLCDTSSGWFGV